MTPAEIADSAARIHHADRSPARDRDRANALRRSLDRHPREVREAVLRRVAELEAMVCGREGR